MLMSGGDVWEREGRDAAGCETKLSSERDRKTKRERGREKEEREGKRCRAISVLPRLPAALLLEPGGVEIEDIRNV